jgi:hypothetical protein
MRLRISRKLIRHLRAQCFARDSFKFEKHRQFFVGANDESSSIVAMPVSNEDCSPGTIQPEKLIPRTTQGL